MDSALSWELDYLYDNLISSDSLLRLSSLRILSTLSTSPDDSPIKAKEIWQLCLQVENTEMTLRNVRERTSNIARLSRLLSSHTINKASPLIDRVISYLLSQLKVNFKPIYSETIDALKELGGSYGEIVWGGVWKEIEKTIGCEYPTITDIGFEKPTWAIIARGNDGKKEEVDEEEAEFRCHGYDKVIRAVEDCWSLSNDVQALDNAEIPVSRSHPTALEENVDGV